MERDGTTPLTPATTSGQTAARLDAVAQSLIPKLSKGPHDYRDHYQQEGRTRITVIALWMRKGDISIRGSPWRRESSRSERVSQKGSRGDFGRTAFIGRRMYLREHSQKQRRNNNTTSTLQTHGRSAPTQSHACPSHQSNSKKVMCTSSLLHSSQKRAEGSCISFRFFLSQMPNSHNSISFPQPSKK